MKRLEEFCPSHRAPVRIFWDSERIKEFDLKNAAKVIVNLLDDALAVSQAQAVSQAPAVTVSDWPLAAGNSYTSRCREWTTYGNH